MMVQAILLALAPVFFVMALGYGAGRFGVVDNRHVDGLNALVMDFALPASIFVATASAPRDETLAQAPLFAILAGIMLAVYLGWYAFARIRGGAADASLQALTIAFPNLAGVGLPITAAVLGPSGTVPVAIGLAAGSLIVSPLTLVLVEMSTAKQGAAGSSSALILRALGRALLKPIVLAPALGIALSLSEIELGRVADACLATDRGCFRRRGAVPHRADIVGAGVPAGLEGDRRHRRRRHRAPAAHRRGGVHPAGADRDREGGGPARRGAVGLLRHPVRGELPAGSRPLPAPWSSPAPCSAP